MIETIRIDRELQNFDAARVPIKSSERVSGDVPYLGASGEVDRVEGFTHEGDYLCVSEDGENLRSRNTPIAWVQRGKFWANNHVHVLGGLPLTRLKFYEAALAVAPISNYITGSAQPKLSQAALSSVLVPKFDPADQAAVGQVLRALDDKIAANRRAIELGRDILQAAWFRGAGENSRKVRLGDVVAVNPNVANSECAEPAYVDMKALPEYGILVSGVGHREAKGGVRFMRGDTLMARITPCFENGKMAYVDVLDDGEVGYGSTEFIVLRSSEGVPSAVPYVVVASAEFRKFAARSMIGTSGRQRVQAKGLEDYEFRWPDDASLAEFGEFSDAMLGRLGAARDENLSLAATRDELLPLLMSGRITVKDAEKTVEEVV